jgi:O-antigen ligase
MLVVLVLTAIAAGRLAHPRDAPLAWVRPVAAIALAAALAVTVIAAAHSGRTGAPTGTSRLTSVESNRYAYWRVALDTFADHPLKGVGTAGYRVEWLQRRHFAETVRDAHSLYLETLAELGIVGFAALAALFGGVAARIRPETAVAGAALAAWAVHAGVDWDWEMPALTLVAVLLAGSVLARAAPRARAGAEQGTLGEVPAGG